MARFKWKDSLLDAREKKKQELNIACNRAILGKFSVMLQNGVTYKFSCDVEAQANFEKIFKAFDKGWTIGETWTAYDENENVCRVFLDLVDFQNVYMTHLAHIRDNVSKFRDFLEPLIDSLEDEEEIKNINWNMSTNIV